MDTSCTVEASQTVLVEEDDDEPDVADDVDDDADDDADADEELLPASVSSAELTEPQAVRPAAERARAARPPAQRWVPDLGMDMVSPVG